MGSGGSRRQRVKNGPETGVNVKRNDGFDEKSINHPNSTSRIKNSFDEFQRKTRPGGNREGRGPDCLGQCDEDIKRELDRVLSDYETHGFLLNNLPRTSSIKSNRHESINFTRGSIKNKPTSSNCFSVGGVEPVTAEKTCCFGHLDPETVQPPPLLLQIRNPAKESPLSHLWEDGHFIPDGCATRYQQKVPFELCAASDGEKCGMRSVDALVTICAVLYNDSEEDLMKTIEKEFN